MTKVYVSSEQFQFLWDYSFGKETWRMWIGPQQFEMPMAKVFGQGRVTYLTAPYEVYHQLIIRGKWTDVPLN